MINYNKKDIIEKETKLREFENEIESEERSQNSKNETKLSNLIKKVNNFNVLGYPETSFIKALSIDLVI